MTFPVLTICDFRVSTLVSNSCMGNPSRWPDTTSIAWLSWKFSQAAFLRNWWSQELPPGRAYALRIHLIVHYGSCPTVSQPTSSCLNYQLANDFDTTCHNCNLSNLRRTIVRHLFNLVNKLANWNPKSTNKLTVRFNLLSHFLENVREK